MTSKRAEIAPRPGFMRQLQALDASLQRVVRSSMRGASDAALRRYSEWDPALIAPTPPVAVTDAALEEELVLHHTYANGKNVAEDVILAARSSTPIARACARSRRGGPPPFSPR